MPAGMVGHLPAGVFYRPLSHLDYTIASLKANLPGRVDKLHMSPLIAVMVNIIGNLAEQNPLWQ
jgi:hypothetical protein